MDSAFGYHILLDEYSEISRTDFFNNTDLRSHIKFRLIRSTWKATLIQKKHESVHYFVRLTITIKISNVWNETQYKNTTRSLGENLCFNEYLIKFTPWNFVQAPSNYGNDSDVWLIYSDSWRSQLSFKLLKVALWPKVARIRIY